MPISVLCGGGVPLKIREWHCTEPRYRLFVRERIAALLKMRKTAFAIMEK